MLRGDDAEALPPFTAEVAAQQEQPHQPQANDEPTEQAQQLEAQQQQPPEQAQPQQHGAQQQELTMEQQQQDNMMNWLTEEGLFDAVVQMTQDRNNNEDNPNNNDNHNNGDITIDAIHDGVVGNDTLRQYMSEIIKFLVWCPSDKPDWLHPPATARLDTILQRRDNERMRAYTTRTRQQSNRFYKRLTQIQFSLWRQSLLWNSCPLSCRIATKYMVGISRNLDMVIFVLHCFTCFICIIIWVSLTNFVWSLATCSKALTEA